MKGNVLGINEARLFLRSQEVQHAKGRSPDKAQERHLLAVRSQKALDASEAPQVLWWKKINNPFSFGNVSTHLGLIQMRRKCCQQQGY
jgi:hypothetical protein